MPRRRHGRPRFGRRARQGLTRTGKNLTWPGGRRRRPGRNRNSARGDRGCDRPLWDMRGGMSWLSRSQRRSERGRAGSRRRRSLGMHLAGGRLRSFCYRFMLGSGGRARRLGGSFGHVLDRGFRFHRGGARRPVRFLGQPALDLYGDRFIDRAGVGFLFNDAQAGEHVEDHVRFHLELARQLVNSNFDHTVCPAVQFRHRGCQIKPCSLSRAPAPAGVSVMSIVTDCSCAASACFSSVSPVSEAAAGSADAASPSPPDSNWP